MTSADGSLGTTPARTDRPIDVLLVTSETCHFCEAAKKLIASLSDEYPIQLRVVDMIDEEGAKLMRQNRVPFPPALLVSGEMHGHGRISEHRLRRTLDDLMRRS